MNGYQGGNPNIGQGTMIGCATTNNETVHDQDLTEDPYRSEIYQGYFQQRKYPPNIISNNIILTVKNIDNLDEFSLKTFVEPDYIPKL